MQMMDDIDFALPIPSNLVPGHKKHSRDLSMVLEPLHQLFHVLKNGKEGLMGLDCNHVSVGGVLSTKDPPELEVEAKPGNHGEGNKGGKKVF